MSILFFVARGCKKIMTKLPTELPTELPTKLAKGMWQGSVDPLKMIDVFEIAKDTLLYHGETGVDVSSLQELQSNLPLYAFLNRELARSYAQVGGGAGERRATGDEAVREYRVLSDLRLALLTANTVRALLGILQGRSRLRSPPVSIMQTAPLSSKDAVEVLVRYFGGWSTGAFEKTRSGRTVLLDWDRVHIATTGPLPKSIAVYNYTRKIPDCDAGLQKCKFPLSMVAPKLFLGRLFMSIVCGLGFDGVRVPAGFTRPDHTPFHPEVVLCRPLLEAVSVTPVTQSTLHERRK